MIDKRKTGKIALLFTTRNNYQLFDEIFFKHTTVDFSNYHIFNIDLNSDYDQKELAKVVFKKYNITDIPVDSGDKHLPSVCRDIELCIQYIEENNLDIDWVMWFSHDCHLIGDDFLEKLEEKIDRNPRFLKEVGAIGFCDYNQIEVGKPLYGRGNLIRGILDEEKPHHCWYQDLPPEYEKADYFVVETPNDNGVLININLWQKYIKPDYGFVLYIWADDICAQFGLNGIASITIPSLEMADLYRQKPMFGVSRSIDSNDKHHIDKYNNPVWKEYWKQKYHFYIGYYKKDVVRQEFMNIKRKYYAGTIQEKIFSWHINDGPKNLDDLKG